MSKTREQERALTECASAVAHHILTAKEARDNADASFQQALDESFVRLDSCRKRLRELQIIPLF
jgi:hypothetical protein